MQILLSFLFYKGESQGMGRIKGMWQRRGLGLQAPKDLGVP